MQNWPSPTEKMRSQVSLHIHNNYFKAITCILPIMYRQAYKTIRCNHLQNTKANILIFNPKTIAKNMAHLDYGCGANDYLVDCILNNCGTFEQVVLPGFGRLINASIISCLYAVCNQDILCEQNHNMIGCGSCYEQLTR